MKTKIAAAIGIIGLAAILGISFYYTYGQQQPVNVQILNLNAVHTGGEIFTIHYTISGTAVNSGGSTSHPIVLLITITDDNQNTLYTTTTSPEPVILQPGQEAPFYKQITSNDLGGYKGQFTYRVSVEQE